MSSRSVGNNAALLLAVVLIFIGLYGLGKNLSLTLPDHVAGGGHWQFLTNLLLVYSLVVFAVGALSHITKSPALFALKNILHPVGMALEFVVAGVYWPLRLFFITLLVSDPSKFKLPLTTDLCIHLMPVVSLFLDYILFLPPWTLSNTQAFVIFVLLSLGYRALLGYLIEDGALYPYNFLNVDTELQRAVVFCIVGLVGFFLFLFAKRLYRVFIREIKAKQN